MRGVVSVTLSRHCVEVDWPRVAVGFSFVWRWWWWWVGGWAAALAEPWANCRMFTLRRGTGLIITAGPGHIKGLRKGQTFC